MPICLGDVGAVIELTIKEDGVAVDISGATTKDILLKDPNGKVTLIAAAFTVAGVDGKIKITTIAGQINRVGTWSATAHLAFGTWDGHTEAVTFQVIDHASV